MRISRLTIQGFRSFGKNEQRLDLDARLAIVWGPNSEGKTSLAEAFEFLLTGDIARRKLLASAVDEFSNALCNAHLPDGTPTFVEASILGDDGAAHTLRRTLSCDFSKKNTCESALELDGAAATSGALASIGIVLSEPPLSAPVLMQHTLGYLFSAKPQERSVYFKSLLEVMDLDILRDSLRDLTDGLNSPTGTHLTRFDSCLDVASIAADFGPLREGVPSVADIRDAAVQAAESLLAVAGVTPSMDPSERLAQLDQVVADRRARTFPLAGFARGAEALEWSEAEPSVWADIDTCVTKFGDVDDETQRLTALFQKVLALPAVEEAMSPIDCPVCETPSALTPERIGVIGEKVAANAGLQAAEDKSSAALRSLDAAALALAEGLDRSLPRFLTWDRTTRRSQGFRSDRLAPLLDEADRPLLGPWFRAAVALARKRRELSRLVERARTLVAEGQTDIIRHLHACHLHVSDLRSAFGALAAFKATVAASIAGYAAAAQSVVVPLRIAVDQKSDSTAWADLAELGRNPNELRLALIDRKAFAALEAELSRACKEVDAAKEAVLEEKFRALADDVAAWWELLRPGEAAFFSGLGLRKGAQRNIDFKAGLAPSTDRRDEKIRDAIAVFSQSQLHCLGLATFLARAGGGGGFIVLDDPIISIDDDYSVHFIDAVLEELLDRDVQVILLTYEQKTWRTIQERYDNGQCEAFQLSLDDPGLGTVIEKSSDTLSVMMKAAEPLTRSNVLSTRKDCCQRVRDCGERFCKELLVKKRREQGDSAALTTDYSGSKGNLEFLINETIPYLRSSDEPGKLKMLRQLINPGNHDDDVPPKSTLAVCLGNLRALKKKYL